MSVKKLAFSTLALVLVVLALIVASSEWAKTRVEYSMMLWSGEHQEAMEEAVKVHLEGYDRWQVEEVEYRGFGIVRARYFTHNKHLQGDFLVMPCRIAIHGIFAWPEFVVEHSVPVQDRNGHHQYWWVEVLSPVQPAPPRCCGI